MDTSHDLGYWILSSSNICLEMIRIFAGHQNYFKIHYISTWDGEPFFKTAGGKNKHFSIIGPQKT